MTPALGYDTVDCTIGVHRDAIEHVVTKLHKPTCTKKSKLIEGKTIDDILHML